MKMTPDEIQMMCFLACFNCIRTRNVISIPTPIRYADLCAYRAKAHLEAQSALNGGSNPSLISGRSGGSGNRSAPDAKAEAAFIKELNKQAKLHENVKNRLFYC